MDSTFILSQIQGRDYLITLGKWWQVLTVLIVVIVAAVLSIMRASHRKQS